MNASIKRLTVSGFGDRRSTWGYLIANEYIKQYGATMQVPEIGRRAKCTACGCLGGAIQVVAAGP